MGYASLEEALTVGLGVERSFVCPVHDDTNPSASVNSLSGFWCCYSCGAWGKVDMDKIPIDPAAVKNMVTKVMKKLDPVHQTYPEGWLSVFDAAGPGEYWLSRFSVEACQRFRLGMTTDGDFATVPMRDNSGNVLGIIRRDLHGGGRKYQYPYGVDVSKYMFNYHTLYDDRLILTEGATDAIAAWETGYSAAALYGSRLSSAQIHLIKRYHPKVIYSAHDQDTAGEQAYARLYDVFGKDFQVRRMYWDSYKDLASIPLPERRHMMQEIFQEDTKKKLLKLTRQE